MILHKRISTTLAKAKALRTFVEPLFTRSKDDSTHNRRMVFSYLQNKEAVSELFREISKKISDRPGGYTRILKTGNRLGDNADMCIIELVDYNEAMLGSKEAVKAKATRRKRTAPVKKKGETETAETDKTKAVTGEANAEATAEKKPKKTVKKTVETEEHKTEELPEQPEQKEEPGEEIK